MLLLLMVQIPFEDLGPAKISKRAPSAALPSGRLTPPISAMPAHEQMLSSTFRLSQHTDQGDALHAHQSFPNHCSCAGPAVLIQRQTTEWLVLSHVCVCEGTFCYAASPLGQSLLGA